MSSEWYNREIGSKVSDLFPMVQVNREPVVFYQTESPSNKHKRYLDQAVGVALTSECRQKHGAIVVRHSKVLGASTNINKNDPQFVDHRHASVHAEVAALRKAGWPQKATVYVARVNRSGEVRLSKPCPTCQVVLDEMKCRVFYTESGAL